ncbi:hypothetical protein CAEBREN_20174 [Caenorhabditis brenneri]|uniref:Uncharacterized protein n=1 Tax=Caenorhabditis brenneri TaxID=135651 RepID=G0N5E5_CAEBE|nr:hypothetical protein CAEBREN_20174 [Caenorhabditis brenneri]
MHNFSSCFKHVIANYGLHSAFLAVGLLGTICLDTYVAWRENLFLATSEDDQYSILIYFFGSVGYFVSFQTYLETHNTVVQMVCAVLGDIIYDRPHSRPALGVLDGFVISVVHTFLLICYFIYWMAMPMDEWNPCYFYMPDFYWCKILHFFSFSVFPLSQLSVSYRVAPVLLSCQLMLTVICAFVLHRKR